jgi:hypothetical protein
MALGKCVAGASDPAWYYGESLMGMGTTVGLFVLAMVIMVLGSIRRIWGEDTE